jgi:hypothetical protein
MGSSHMPPSLQHPMQPIHAGKQEPYHPIGTNV